LSTEGSPIAELRGGFDATEGRFALLVSRFHSDVTDRLLEGARACLLEHGADDTHIEVVRVAGAWELPQLAAHGVRLGRHEAIIALGCVIRGETPHFEYVCSAASNGLGAVAREAAMPVLFGVLTTDNHAQALARAGQGKDNKGYECAMAALEMIQAFRKMEIR
jgi:6,7-dimethyl-8-ribityllumazine synthase